MICDRYWNASMNEYRQVEKPAIDHFVAITHLKVKLSQGKLEIFCDNSKIL